MVVDRKTLDFRNKLILAPMVRVGTLPMRILALECGADIVYSEELIDLKLGKCKRKENPILGTVDFVDPSDGSVIFRTCDFEKAKVVLQLGTSDHRRALHVGKLVQDDITAIDINMGCPKEFSIKGGMGAALLSQPEKAKKILKTLVDNLTIPVTCKIRILPTVEDTIELVKDLATTGIAAIGIHARTRSERPNHSPHPEVIREIMGKVNIPVICNGGSKSFELFEDIETFRLECGADSVMIARAAQLNVSILRRDGLLPMDDVIRRYLKLCVDYDNTPSNTKYCVQSILQDQQETPKGKKFLTCQTLQQICELWDLGDYCYKQQLKYQELGMQGRRDVVPGMISSTNDEPESKRARLSEDTFQSNIAFFRTNYDDTTLPKSVLHKYALKTGRSYPTYVTQQEDKLFRTICTFDGRSYASTYWEKNKKFAEQGSALVCLLGLELVNEEDLIRNGSILR